MLFDPAARKSLAQKILGQALAQRRAASGNDELVPVPDGSVGVACEAGAGEPRLGFIYCHYLPASAVEELLVACEQAFYGSTDFDRWEEVSLAQRQEAVNHICSMTLSATHFLLENLAGRVRDALEENIEDSLEYVTAHLASNMANYYGPERVSKVDVRERIRSRAEESGKKRSDRLFSVLKNFPGLRVPKDKRARARKDTWDKAVTGHTFKTQIVSAICALRNEPERVTRKNVAIKLGWAKARTANPTHELNRRLIQANLRWEDMLALADERCPKIKN